MINFIGKKSQLTFNIRVLGTYFLFNQMYVWKKLIYCSPFSYTYLSYKIVYKSAKTEKIEDEIAKGTFN